MRRFKLLTMLLCTLSLACSKQSSESVDSYDDADSQGQVELACSIAGSAEVVTRATDYGDLVVEDGKIYLPSSILPSADDFKVEITGSYIVPDEVVGGQQEGGDVESVSISYDKLSDYTSELPYLYAGDYTVTLSYGDVTDEGYENPCYYTTYDFVVSARKVSQESISVPICNSIIRGITTTESFDNYYVSSDLTITTTKGTELNIEANAMTLFFVQPSTTLTLSGTAVKTNGTTVSFSGVIGKTTAQECYTIELDAEDVGGGGISVSFDSSISEFEVVETSDELNPDSN
ncbi:MAG: DUF4493 domain-containing protein [Rikenellaceae bacterium]